MKGCALPNGQGNKNCHIFVTCEWQAGAYKDFMRRIIVKTIILGLALRTIDLPAATLVTNLTNSMSEETQFWEGSPLYQSFTVGTSPATINAVTLSTGFIVNPTGMQVALFSDFSGAPYQSIGTFTFFGPPAGIPNKTPTFTASSESFNVNANTTYWIQVTSFGGGPGDSNYLSITSNTAETGLPGWSLGDSHLYTYYGSTPQVYVGNPIRMEISGVPEPSSISLVALGLCSLALRRRRI
ncbi:MAG: PEP-CTERM sorting domain-containing protein [Verrucomicrobia bacterium]|nr:PEP-CTERM sorting domain-containing protein [Verrucomicrobiota bacterium]